MAELTFSERMGFQPIKAPQVEGMDRDLRVSLWNAITKYLDQLESRPGHDLSGFMTTLLEGIWERQLKWPLNLMPRGYINIISQDACWEKIQAWYFNKDREWHSIYSFVEFLAKYKLNNRTHDLFVKWVNEGLENENSAYRLVNGTFVPITNEEELKAVQEAAQQPNAPLAPVSMHIAKAIEHLSDKTAPDYRNSMKESISAVEAICKLIAGTPSATLAPALDRVASELNIHATLKEGFKKIYGYTSDAHGIRHALKDKDHPTQEDARFMLVTCSAFVNYIIELARKQGKLPSS